MYSSIAHPSLHTSIFLTHNLQISHFSVDLLHLYSSTYSFIHLFLHLPTNLFIYFSPFTAILHLHEPRYVHSRPFTTLVQLAGVHVSRTYVPASLGTGMSDQVYICLPLFEAFNHPANIASCNNTCHRQKRMRRYLKAL